MFCVDEKTAIQALDRLDPVLPLSPGRDVIACGVFGSVSGLRRQLMRYIRAYAFNAVGGAFAVVRNVSPDVKKYRPSHGA